MRATTPALNGINGALYGLLQVHCHRRQQVLESPTDGVLADGVHFPLALMTIQLGHNHRRMGASTAEVIFGNFLVVGGIEDAAEGVFDLIEGHVGEAVYRKHQRLHRCRYRRQVHDDLLIIPISIPGAIIARVGDTTVLAAELTEIHGVHDVVFVVKKDAGRIQINVRGASTESEETLCFLGIPTESHDDLGERFTRFFIERDLLSFGKTDSHITRVG